MARSYSCDRFAFPRFLGSHNLSSGRESPMVMYALFFLYEAYSFTTDGYGIFNVRIRRYVGVCRTHEWLGVGGGVGGRGG